MKKRFSSKELKEVIIKHAQAEHTNLHTADYILAMEKSLGSTSNKDDALLFLALVACIEGSISFSFADNIYGKLSERNLNEGLVHTFNDFLCFDESNSFVYKDANCRMALLYMLPEALLSKVSIALVDHLMNWNNSTVSIEEKHYAFRYLGLHLSFLVCSNSTRHWEMLKKLIFDSPFLSEQCTHLIQNKWSLDLLFNAFNIALEYREIKTIKQLMPITKKLSDSLLNVEEAVDEFVEGSIEIALDKMEMAIPKDANRKLRLKCMCGAVLFKLFNKAKTAPLAIERVNAILPHLKDGDLSYIEIHQLVEFDRVYAKYKGVPGTIINFIDDSAFNGKFNEDLSDEDLDYLRLHGTNHDLLMHVSRFFYNKKKEKEAYLIVERVLMDILTEKPSISIEKIAKFMDAIGKNHQVPFVAPLMVTHKEEWLKMDEYFLQFVLHILIDDLSNDVASLKETYGGYFNLNFSAEEFEEFHMNERSWFDLEYSCDFSLHPYDDGTIDNITVADQCMEIFYNYKKWGTGDNTESDYHYYFWPHGMDIENIIAVNPIEDIEQHKRLIGRLCSYYPKSLSDYLDLLDAKQAIEYVANNEFDYKNATAYAVLADRLVQKNAPESTDYFLSAIKNLNSTELTTAYFIIAFYLIKNNRYSLFDELFKKVDAVYGWSIFLQRTVYMFMHFAPEGAHIDYLCRVAHFKKNHIHTKWAMSMQRPPKKPSYRERRSVTKKSYRIYLPYAQLMKKTGGKFNTNTAKSALKEFVFECCNLQNKYKDDNTVADELHFLCTSNLKLVSLSLQNYHMGADYSSWFVCAMTLLGLYFNDFSMVIKVINTFCINDDSTIKKMLSVTNIEKGTIFILYGIHKLEDKTEAKKMFVHLSQMLDFGEEGNMVNK